MAFKLRRDCKPGRKERDPEIIPLRRASWRSLCSAPLNTLSTVRVELVKFPGSVGEGDLSRVSADSNWRLYQPYKNGQWFGDLGEVRFSDYWINP